MKTIITILALACATATAVEASTGKNNNCSYTRQVDLLAKVMYHEARGEENDGMLAVGEVVINRVDSPNYPDTVCSVILAPSQFSPKVKNPTPNLKDPAWKEAKLLAIGLLSGEEGLGHGATHFLNPRDVARQPTWTKKFDRVGRIGNHVFYSDGSND